MRFRVKRGKMGNINKIGSKFKSRLVWYISIGNAITTKTVCIRVKAQFKQFIIIDIGKGKN
jgi:hypothetical protein